MGNLLLLISTGEREFLPPVSTATSATSGWCIRISAVGGDKRQDQRCGGRSKAALVFFGGGGSQVLRRFLMVSWESMGTWRIIPVDLSG